MSNYILHIETATKVCSVGLSLNGELIALKETSSDQYIHGESLNLYIQDVLSQAKIKINHLSAVSISSGPGSYTGLRIGVSTVKGLCYALSIPLISISTLDSIYLLAKKIYSKKQVCVMLDARRMEVYSQIWSSEGIVIKALSADVLDEQSYKEFIPFVCCGDGASKMVDIWQQREIDFDLEITPSASGQVVLAYEKYLKSDFVDVSQFVPNYLKDFQSTGH